MKTALVRLSGNLKIMRNDFYCSNKEYEAELRANGYKVLKVWDGNITDKKVNEWEFLNRK